MITGKNLKYLIALLNSKVCEWWIKTATATLGEGSYGAKIYIENTPIPFLNKQNEDITTKLESLVDKILSLKNQNPNADITEYEKQIDQLVYKLYNLTEDEIKIIENYE